MISDTGTCRWKRGDTGLAAILVIGYLAVVSLLAATFLTALNRNITRATKSERHQICVNIAEGGVEQAIASIRGGVDAGQTGALGDGQFAVTVQEVAGALEITSTATLTDSPNVRARVTALVAREAAGGVRVLQWKEIAKW